MNNQLLQGQTALVTGGSEGIGAAIAIALGAAGARVAINYHSHPEGANATLAQIQQAGGSGFIVKADVGKEADVLAMYDEVYQQFTDLDILISNAGIQKDSAFASMRLADWELVINTNLTGSFLCAREAVKGFIKKGIAPARSRAAGKIVFISSVHNVIPWAGHANYATSKGGETMLMKTMAQELAPQKIRVNSIAPGAIKTDINRSVWGDPAQASKLMEMIPYGRMGDPGDIARVALWLASDEADYITGTTIYADGGMTLYPDFMHGG